MTTTLVQLPSDVLQWFCWAQVTIIFCSKTLTRSTCIPNWKLSFNRRLKCSFFRSLCFVKTFQNRFKGHLSDTEWTHDKESFFFASILPKGKITCQQPGKSQTTFVFCRNCGTNFIKNVSCRWRKSLECCQRIYYSEQVSRSRKDTSEVRSSFVTTIIWALPPAPVPPHVYHLAPMTVRPLSIYDH